MKKVLLILAAVFAVSLQQMQAQNKYPDITRSWHSGQPRLTLGDGPDMMVDITVRLVHGWGLNYCNVETTYSFHDYHFYTYQGKRYGANEVKGVGGSTFDASNLATHNAKVTVTIWAPHIGQVSKEIFVGGGFQISGKGPSDNETFNEGWSKVKILDISGLKYTARDIHAENLIKQYLRSKEDEQKAEEYKRNGDSYFGRGDYQAAKAEYQKILAKKPNDNYAKNKIAECDKKIEEEEAAKKMVEEYKRNGDKFFGEGKYEEAKAEYQKILKENPDDSYAKNKVAECDKKIEENAKKKDEEEAKKKEEEGKDKEDKENEDGESESRASTVNAKSAEDLEREYRQRRQRQYDEWLVKEQRQRTQMATEMASSSVGMLFMIGGFMYKGMGNVNPQYVYLDYDNSFKWFAGMDVGYSISVMPSMFSSDRYTMKDGYDVNTQTVEPSTAFTVNLDYKARFGFENNNFGGYAYWAPKTGFSPIFNAYQLSLPNFGANLYGGAKWIKGFTEFEWGQRRFWQNDWTDPEESGRGSLKTGYWKITYGLKFSTAPNSDYIRNHFLIGIIREKAATKDPYTMAIYKDGALMAPNNREESWRVMQKLTGYTFQWKRDHTCNLYVNLYPTYPYTGENIHGTMGTSESLEKFRKGGILLEAGFLRSFDWFGSVYKNTESQPDNSRRFIAFSADRQTFLGVSFGKIDPDKWELYLSARSNPSLPISYPKVGDSKYQAKLDELQRENPGMAFRNPSYDEKSTRYEAANFTLGMTKAVTSPWWIYAGAGVAYSKPDSRERFIDRITSTGAHDGRVSLGHFAGSTGITGENRISPQIEAGAMYLYRKYIATAGLRSDFKGIYPSLSIGITW